MGARRVSWSRVCLLIVGVAALAQPLAEAGWPNVGLVAKDGGSEEYLSLLHPVLQATRLSYTATYGSYRKPGEVNESLGEGWERLRTVEVDPPEGGMHALVFLQTSSRRGLVAFRGTDLNKSGASGRADACADSLLWENATRASLPTECRAFSDQQLDYLAGAMAVARRAAEAMPPGTDLLLVGHSLGAGLAALVAGSWAPSRYQEDGSTRPLSSTELPQVFGLSSPAFDEVLRRRARRDPGAMPTDRTVLVYNRYDPVGVKAREQGGLVGGTVCIFAPPEPVACALCYAKHPFGGPACELCFAQTHTAGLYFQKLNGTVEKPPEFRPACSSASSAVLV